jgi:hypothetical protein
LSLAADGGIALKLRISPTMVLSMWGDFMIIFYDVSPYMGIMAGLSLDMGL